MHSEVFWVSIEFNEKQICSLLFSVELRGTTIIHFIFELTAGLEILTKYFFYKVQLLKVVTSISSRSHS
jgi:hypothetical protein